MIVYHGSNNPKLNIKTNYPSKYGFTVLFATPSIELAKLYVGTALYKLNIKSPTINVDFNFRSIYHNSAKFDRIIKEYHKLGYTAIRISNCIDAPNRGTKWYVADIIAIFNPKIINHLDIII